MAETLMDLSVSDLLAPVRATSAGLLEGGRTSPPEVLELMAAIGADLSSRTSRQVSIGDVHAADLVLTMERMQLRELAVMTPRAWGKIFTLKEFVRRGGSLGGRLKDEAVDAWIARVHDGRQTADLLDESPIDDVEDPYGGSPEQYRATKVELEALVARVADLLFGEPPPLADPDVAAVTAAEKPARSRFGLVRRG